MEDIRKPLAIPLENAALRQYSDARAAFAAYRQAVTDAKEVRGGMYWRQTKGRDYLIRTSTTNAQKSLGVRSVETEAIYTRFQQRKTLVEGRLRDLTEVLRQHKRLNRALFVGRAPQTLVDIVQTLTATGLAEFFTVIGTHALYAYEAAAGVRIDDSQGTLATKDVDLLWDTRKRVQFLTTLDRTEASMLGLLQRVDPSFKLRPDQPYTAVNAKGFEVDILRREAIEADPHPLKISHAEEDFWIVQARRAGDLLNARPFSAMVVSPAGDMAWMKTIAPQNFAEFKRWLAEQPDRDPLKRSRDLDQANVTELLIEEYGLGVV